MYSYSKIIAGVFLTFIFSASQGATVLWDESTDGDASNTFAGAEVLNLVIGENLISGSQSWGTDQDVADFDFYSFTVPVGLQITSIFPTVSNGAGSGVYIWSLADPLLTTIMTKGLNTDGSISDFLSPTFPLSSGQYPLGGASAFAAGTSLDYEWSVTTTAVPVPPAVWLFGSALGLMGWIKRKAAKQYK